jgi:hypothetical protein
MREPIVAQSAFAGGNRVRGPPYRWLPTPFVPPPWAGTLVVDYMIQSELEDVAWVQEVGVHERKEVHHSRWRRIGVVTTSFLVLREECGLDE